MNNNLYKTLVENTANGIFLYKDDEIVFNNRAFARMLGYSQDELKGNDIDAIIHPSHKEKFNSNLTRLRNNHSLETNHHEPIEVKAVLKENGSPLPGFINSLINKNDDKSIWLKMHLSPVELDGEKYILGNVFNIEKDLEKEVKLEKIYKGVIDLIAGTVETNNIYQGKHHKQIKDLTVKIADEMGLSEDQKISLKYASMVHGIGKLTVPAEILSSTGELTSIEFSYLKEHPKKGYELLRNIEFPWPIADILYQHHERIDGSGYPNGLEGDEIILEAKIFAVADVIIAMASQRPYREAYHIGEVLQEIINQKGKLYDSDVVNDCVKVLREGYVLIKDEN